MSSPAMTTGNTYQANLYPTQQQQGASTPVGAVCFSGGGSRALSCALGQLSALTSLSLLEKFAYISSVSGGSWASVLYTFLPSTFSDTDFLISYAAPKSLSQSSMQTMAATCLGSVPQKFSLECVADFIYQMWQWGALDPLNDMASWFWIAGVGELVLKPFGLYDATYSSDSPYLLPTSFFSLSQEYVTQNLVPKNPGLANTPFYTVSANGRPSLIVNFNLLDGDYFSDPPQMPIQATAISTGAPGGTPNIPGETIIGGGSVESFAFTSTLNSGGTPNQTASVTINRQYSLCDVAGCSSAFFAEYLLAYIGKMVDDLVNTIAAKYDLSPLEKEALKLLLSAITSVLGEEVIPAYNYWTLGEVGQNNPTTPSYGFSDGGDFDNSGILGVLAQTNVNRIVAFINSEIPISKVGTNYFVDPSLPLLFGNYYPSPDDSQPYQPFSGGMSPAQPMSYVQVFDNSTRALDELCAGLYAASCGSSQLGTYTACFQQTLTTVANPVANIAAGRQITVLWVYNNRVNNWQSQIADKGLLGDLTSGQANQNSDGTPNGGTFNGPFPTLANFPYYDTGLQIYLYPEAVYMLAQLSAWNVEQLQNEISNLFSMNG